MTKERPRRKRRSGRPRRWHRLLGAAFALPLLWLTASGLLLQHQTTLGLDEKLVKSAWLLKRYNQIPDSVPMSVSTSSGGPYKANHLSTKTSAAKVHETSLSASATCSVLKPSM